MKIKKEMHGNEWYTVVYLDDDKMVMLTEDENQSIWVAIEAACDMSHMANFSPEMCATVLDDEINKLYPDSFDETRWEEVCLLASMLAWACYNYEKNLAYQIIIELGRCA